MSLMIDGWMPSVGSSSSSTFGSARQRACDRQLLLLAARQVAAAPLSHLREHREQTRKISSRHSALPVATGRSRCSPRRSACGKIMPALRDVGEPCWPRAGSGFMSVTSVPSDRDLPAARRHDADQGLQQRGLAHAVAAHDRDDLARRRPRDRCRNHLALPVADVRLRTSTSSSLMAFWRCDRSPRTRQSRQWPR